MNAKEEKKLGDGLRDAIASVPPESALSVERFLEHFIRAAGGTEEFARLAWAEFVAAKPGSIVRSRMVEMYIRALKFTEGRVEPEDPGMLSEEDLRRKIEEKLAALAGRPDARPA